MKFSSAVDVMQKENRYLKTLSQILLLIIVCLTIMDFMLYDRVPIIVETGLRGREILKATEPQRSMADLEQAVRLMMKARFDSNTQAPELFVSDKELLLRKREQVEMKSRGMEQTVVTRSVHIDKNIATVDIDRLISIGELRSALKAKLKITFEEQSPNELNPYGLLLSAAEPVQVPTPTKGR
jgi:hypothetical protein